MTARLITIPFSHYCEKVRWALDRCGIPFVEDGHLPVLHRRATRRVGGTSVPVLVTSSGAVLTNSTAILHHADTAGAPPTPLWPAGADDVVAWEERFDRELGPHARRVGYFHILTEPAFFRRLVRTAAVPGWQRTLAVLAAPAVRARLRHGLRVTPDGVARSRDKLMALFADVGACLADGRRHLGGDAFTAADLTFAALAAPLVMPERYARWLFPLAEAPGGFQREVEQWRSTPAGVFALRLYDETRG